MSEIQTERRLRLDPDTTLADGLRQAFRAIVERATACAQGTEGDRERTVHEFRKAVRRARAMVALTRDLLGPSARDIGRKLRSASRATSELRDHDVFPEVLSAVELPEGLREKAEVARARLGEGSTDEGALVVLERAGADLGELADRFDAALPETVAWDDVERGLRRSYRRSRDRWKRAQKSGRARDLHDWRKRSKELTYQLELLGRGRGGAAAARRRQLADLAEELGAVTDRVQLTRKLRGQSGARALARAVKDERKARMKEALRRGGECFALSPKRFANEVVSELAEPNGGSADGVQAT